MTSQNISEMFSPPTENSTATYREAENTESKFPDIKIETVVASLKKRDSDQLKEIDMFIRDSFDYLFFRMGIFEHYIERGLIDFEDVEYPIEYYVEKMFDSGDFDAFGNYLVNYGFWRTLNFISRFCPKKENCDLKHPRPTSDICLKKEAEIRSGLNGREYKIFCLDFCPNKKQ